MRVGIGRKLFGSIVGAFLVVTAVVATFVVWTFVVTEGMLGMVEDMGAISRRMNTTAHLQVQLHELISTSSDYLITGNIEKRDEFDGIITGLLAVINELEEHRGGVRWNEALKNVREGTSRLSEMTLDLMYTDDPVGNREAARLMEEAAAFAEGVTNDAGEFHNIAVMENMAMVEDASQRIARMRVALYVLPLLGILLFAMLYLYLKHHITMPLTEFYKGADRISRGDFEHSVTVTTGDELEGLAEGFNRMAVALKEREAKLLSLLKVTDRINEELITASQHKVSFLANISHELKTPLTHVLGFSELLKMEGGAKLDKTNRKYVEFIHKSGQDLLELINSMLEVTRSSGAAELELKEFPVRAVVDEVVGKIRHDSDIKTQTLKVDIDEDVDSFRADRNMFSQMLASLLSNAVKFTPQNGDIYLKLEKTVEDDKGFLKITVRDTGVGISAEKLNTIFNTFEVADSSPTREFGGLGIGLALTKRFVVFHGGKINVESEVGKGSTFVVKLPMSISGMHEGNRTIA